MRGQSHPLTPTGWKFESLNQLELEVKQSQYVTGKEYISPHFS